MRARILPLIGLCAAVLAACASTPTHEEMTATFDAGLKDYDAGDFKAAYEKWHEIDDYDLAAMRNVAVMLREGKGVEKDPKAAQKKMQRAADAGLVTAQADLGEMLLNGEAGAADPAAAAPWLARAAEGGHPIAAYQLAQLYEAGTGVPKDLTLARKLYEIAVKAGVAGAAERLNALPASPAPATIPPPPELRH